VLGTLAVEQPELAFEALQRWGRRSHRPRTGRSRGVRAGARLANRRIPLPAIDVAAKLPAVWPAVVGLYRHRRDGLQTGLNLPATVELAQVTGLRVIASGGVRGREDITAARRAGLAGVIAGRALYEGNLPVEGLFE
jgi:phosphoribosylformimino-5-aminoimidazole carboxamide ribotide isomerase